MATKSQIYKEALRELEIVRTQNEADLRQRKATLYEKLPRLEEIERELALLGVKTAMAVLGSDMTSGDMVEQLQMAQKTRRDERNTILDEANLSPRLLEMEYSCLHCKDTGYIETERCACLKRRVMDKLYDQSNVRKVIQAENFEHFNVRLYSEKINTAEGISPRDNAQKVFRRALAFVDDFDRETENLLLYGGTGLGKTFLCNCIAKELLEKGKTVLYLTAGQLFKKLEEQHFHRDDDEEAKDWETELMEAELLIIDDLGTEFPTVFTTSELFRIINDRKLSKRLSVISTNLNPNELTQLYSDRIASRLLGEYQPIKFFGEDIRIVKKMKGM